MADTSHYEQGQQDCRAYYESQGFAALSRTIRPEDAMRLFWPPVNEQLMMVSTPMPKDRAKWMVGFKAERTAIIQKMESNDD